MQPARLVEPIMAERLDPARIDALLLEADAQPAECREIVLARLRILLAYFDLDLQASHGQHQKLQARFANDYAGRRLSLPASVYRTVPRFSTPTLRRWINIFCRDGVDGLAPRYRGRANDGIIDRDPELSEFIIAQIAARPTISTANLISALRARFASDDRFGDGRPLPGYRTLQRWATRYKRENASALLAIGNPDAWRSKYQAAAGSASEGVTRPNQLWELDSTIGDVLLVDPETDRPRRWAIVKCIDVATRRSMMLVARSSTAAAIAALLRKCILAWGVPERIKRDNGADYTSHAIEQLLDGLAIEVETCPPFTPEAKPHVERAFKSFQHSIVELLPGYAGHSVAERAGIESRRAFADRLGKACPGQGSGGDRTIAVSLTPDDFQAICDRWCEDVYAHRVHSSLGRSPFQAAASYRGAVRRITDERALDILLLPASGQDAVRTVAKKGVAIGGGQYAHAALGPRVGEPVRVLTDPADLGHVYVFDLNGLFLCEAESPARRGVSASEVAAAKKAIQKAAMAEQKGELRRLMRSVKTDDIAAEILDAARADTHTVVAFRREEQRHETETLSEAGQAARASDFTPRTDTEAERAAKQRLGERAGNAKPAAVTSLAERQSKFDRALAIECARAQGRGVSDDDARWYALYSQSAEYRAAAAMRARFKAADTG